METVHVIGAGLSGLSCALRLGLAGRQVAIYEAAGHAGGRCRSFVDDSLGCLIDNGSHMLMGANEATRSFLFDIGSRDALQEVAPAAFPFHDVRTGRSWCVRPNAGPIPLWMWMPNRRVPGTRASDYLAAFRLARAGPDDTIADCVGADSALYETFWQPLSQAVLNTDAHEGSAKLLWSMVSATFLRGEAACRPLHFHKGLSPGLIDPAVATLKGLGADIRFKARLRRLERSDDRVTGLHFPDGLLRLGRDDIVVLAVPPDACADVWPEAETPTESRAIVNAHFKLPERIELPHKAPFLGLIGAQSQWIFVRDKVLSVTISAADSHVEQPGWQIANMLWGEVAGVLGRNVGRVPPWRVIKEKRATIAQTPAQIRLRPGARTSTDNLFLAGDWTATGLPATIEGSIRSGYRAADCALERAGESTARTGA